MKTALPLAVVLLLAACSSKPAYQPLPLASPSSTDNGEELTLTGDGTLCDRLAACAPHTFTAEYPGGRPDCIVNLYGTGRGVHVLASTSDECITDVTASCDFVGDAGADAAHFQPFNFPSACRSF